MISVQPRPTQRTDSERIKSASESDAKCRVVLDLRLTRITPSGQ